MWWIYILCQILQHMLHMLALCSNIVHIHSGIRGIRSQAPTVDLLGALGKMRQRFRARVPDETLALHGESWFQEVMQTVYDDLPAAGLLPPPPQKRMSAKTRV